MHKSFLAAALVMASAVWAQAPTSAPPSANAPGVDRAEQFDSMKASKIGQALGLDNARTQQVKTTLDSFAPRRKALHQQMAGNVQVLRKAAQGDASAASQVDQAIQQSTSLRQQMAQLNEDLFTQLSQGLNPQQKAKLALALHDRMGHGRFKHLHHNPSSSTQNPATPTQSQ